MSDQAIPPELRRVVAIGSESTGKTELITWLARELDVPWSAEYSREYAEAHGGGAALTAADVEPIARGQLALETRAIQDACARGSSVVLHDTDLLSTRVYAMAYYGEGAVPAWLDDALAVRAPDLYLLCDIDVPFRSDPARDATADREAMQRRFVEALEEREARYVTIRGSWGERQAQARQAVEALQPQ